MPYLQRLSVRPSIDDLTANEAKNIQQVFDPYAGEVIIYGERIAWNEIDEIEVVQAARASGPGGWLTKRLLGGIETFHIGIYYGRSEEVLPNVSYNLARYIVQTIAYHAPQAIRYKGVEGITPLTTDQ